MTDPVPGEMPPATSETPVEDSKELSAAELAAELADAKKRLREVNRESAERRKRLEALEQAETERKASEMSEAQKLQAKVEAAEKDKQAALAKANSRILRAEIIARAANTFVDPEDVFLALRDKLAVNDEGEIDGLDEALKELAKHKPHWTRKQAAQLSATNPAQAQASGETDAQRRARIYGAGGGIFDPNVARGHGGGVLFDPEANTRQRPKQ